MKNFTRLFTLVAVVLIGWANSAVYGQVSITCPANMSVPNDLGECSAVVTYTAPIGTGSGTNITTTQIVGLPSGSEFPVGTTQITFQVTNDEGDNDQCTFYITVNDVEDPVIDCPADIYVDAVPGTCEQVVNFDTPDVTDNCGVISMTQIGGLPSGSSFPVGENFVDFEAVDANGNSGFCRIIIYVSDVNDPTITCPDDITVVTTTTCGAEVNYIPPVGSDLCQPSVTTQIGGLGSGAIFPVGVTTETYQVMDPEGNTATCSFDVTVLDEGLPVFDSCPADIDVDAAPGDCQAVVTFPIPTATDNCPGVVVTQTQGPASGDNFPAGTTLVVFTATDASGNTATCSFDVTVTENIPPQITCPGDINVANDPGECGAVVNYTAPEGTDNCAGATTILLSGLGSGAQFPIGTTTETYEVTDASGNTATCSFDVTVTDDENPVFTCPGDLAAGTDPGECSTIVNFADPSATDNCPGVTVVQTSGLPSGSAFPAGSSTVEFTATDATGNTAVCSFDIVVTDTEAPTIVCPADFTVAAPAGSCDAEVNYNAPTVDDNCPGTTWSVIGGPTSGSTVSAGSHQVTLQATDAAGNTAECNFTITVTESGLPTITCPDDIMADADPGTCSATVTFPDATATDDCSDVTVAQTGGPASGSAFPAGTTTIEFTATDEFGNSETCTFDILVVDDTPPTIDCPNDIAQENDPGLCGAVVNYAAPSTFDNCGAVTLALIAGLPSGDFFPVGTTTVTYEATDVSGNTAECSFDVVISDTEPPVVSCPTDQTINLPDGDCEQAVNYSLPTATDNCGVDEITLISGPAPGEIFQTGTTTITYEVSDAAGNATTCIFDITLLENVPPEITCPQDIAVSAEEGVCGATVIYTAPEGTDDCAVESTLLTQGLGSGEFFPVGATTETYTVTDASGNVASCSFTITVTDDEQPVFDCPENITVATGPGICEAVVTFGDPTVTDNCDVAIAGVQTAGPASGSTFPVGATTIEYTATDPSGNTALCSFDIIVEDLEAPEMTCPADIIISADPGDCDAEVVFATPVATDNCGVPTVAQTAGLSSGSLFPTGTTTVEFTATDDAGNTTTCSFEVTVTEDDDPVITCPADISVSADAGVCEAVVEYTIDATDDCGEVTLTLIEGLPSGSAFPLGTTTVTYQATDESGNQASCSFDVEVTDDEAPVFDCPENITISNDEGQCGAVYEFELPEAIDNCDANTAVTQTAGPASGSELPVGTTIFTFAAMDAAGNESTCTYEVTVIDDEDPVWSDCPDNVTVELPSDVCEIPVAYTEPTASDNCSVVFDQTMGPASDSLLTAGIYQVEFTAEDPWGNVAFCSFTITVLDTTPPTIECPNSFETCDRIVEFDLPIASDACGIAEVIQISGPESGSSFPVGVSLLEFQATDNNGNFATCSYEIEVLPGATRPVAGNDQIICNQTVTQLLGNHPDFGKPHWELIGGEGDISDPDSAQTTVTGLAEGTNTFVYSIDPQNGCEILTDTISVMVETGIEIDAGPDVSIMLGGSGQLEGSVSPEGGEYYWEPIETLSCVECLDPVASPLETTKYFLHYTSPVGCVAADSVWVRVFRELPNTITPDGDGVNDVWNIPGIENYPEADVFIYNRWGTEVFSSKGYRDPWDGTYKGDDLPTGAYYYIINYNRSGVENLNGTVNIIR